MLSHEVPLGALIAATLVKEYVDSTSAVDSMLMSQKDFACLRTCDIEISICEGPLDRTNDLCMPLQGRFIG